MRRRALFLTWHSRSAASCRYRALQYVPYLEAQGWSVEHWPLMSDRYTRHLLTAGRRLLGDAVCSYSRRLGQLLWTRLQGFDVIFIQGQVFPWIPFFIERALILGRHPGVVVDYDDAIYTQYSGTILRGKIEAVMGCCREVIVGNQTLYQYAAQYAPRVTLIPTVIDLQLYRPKIDYAVEPERPFVIGWIGTAATAKHLLYRVDALRALAREHRITLRCVGAPSDFNISGVDVERISWSEQTEAEVIRGFDIGIMPLTSDAFAGGKCGFKLIQYMAAGVPAVGEHLGANAEIITDGENGLLASTTEEYICKIRLLLQNRKLRETIGRAGRARIESAYCIQKTASLLEGVLQRGCGQKRIMSSVRAQLSARRGIGAAIADSPSRAIKVGIKRNADRGLHYPEPEYLFSPDEHYPEYPFAHLSTKPNPVYRMVRELFREMRLDLPHYGTAEWNPLGEWIQRGQTVFTLVNFVTERRPLQRRTDFEAMLTHPSVIRVVLDYIIIATGDPSIVSFGNAPVQSARMDKLAEQSGALCLRTFYRCHAGSDVGPRDLRLYISRVNSLGAKESARVLDPRDEITFDLGTGSLLDKLPASAFSDFRVEDYGSDATNIFHRKGSHLYKLHRDVVNSDVIFHVAKLKTHGKVAMTGALKGAVGAVSRKECLAHHRHGSAQHGNDEFRRSTTLTRLYAALGNRATADCPNSVRILHKTLGRILDLVLKIDISGSWHGNDTAWRMALDINKCLIYGHRDGSISTTPVRKICCLLDGIVSGEGDGPVHVRSRRDGVLVLSSEPCFADLGAALLMGFDPGRIPLIREAFLADDFPLSSAPAAAAEFLLNGSPVPAVDIPGKIVPQFRPPRGWIGHIEYLAGQCTNSRSNIAEFIVGTVSTGD